MKKIGLYLAGGGARGAYQAGFIKGLYHILNTNEVPFQTISAVSVGSLNGAILAQYIDDFKTAVGVLETVWGQMRSQDVFNASNMQLGKSVFRNVGNLFRQDAQTGFLLDTTPLKESTQHHISCEKLNNNIKQGKLEAFEVITHCYEAEVTQSFFQHYKSMEAWQYPKHLSTLTDISHEQIMASCALPLFFPATQIDGLHYGDGSMGLVFPLRGAIRFNVDKLMIVGTRPKRMLSATPPRSEAYIGFARILGGMLNSVFMDNLDRDIEMVSRMNDIAAHISMWNKRYSPWRPIDTLVMRPSRSLANIAEEQYKNMPTFLRFLLNVLGAQSHSGDLLSFLLFEKSFTRPLMQLGYEDAMQDKDAIARFFQ